MTTKFIPRAVLITTISLQLFAGCATDNSPAIEPTPLEKQEAAGTNEAPLAEGDEEAVAAVATPDKIDEVISHVDGSSTQPSTPVTPNDPNEISDSVTKGTIPQELNENIQKWINFFAFQSHDRFYRYMQRGEKYRPMITKVFQDRGLPPDLYYLAMIESGFATGATSHASAVGLWQFIKGTGKRYGLRVDRHVDERRDPVRSTIAAALYLNDLHNVFQSWYLAMAAYNAGEARIMRAIMQGKSRDFWVLAANRQLPKETMEYIPKFMAAVMIGKNPEKYGFPLPTQEANPQLTNVTVPSPIDLDQIAQLTGISPEEIKIYNPHLKGGLTPRDTKTYRIWVTAEMKSLIEGKREQLAGLIIKTRYQPEDIDPPEFHVVKKGQTLASISRKYGISRSTLKSLNGLKSYKVRAGARLRLRENDEVAANNTHQNEVIEQLNSSDPVHHYRVKKGESLKTIAKKFRVTIKTLKNLNKLKHNKIYAGQIIRVGVAR
jgi:membrane-bound lytic murein transglycosylase D